MDELSLIKESQLLVQKHFEIASVPSVDFEALRKQIHQEINRLLNGDFNHLLNILYRIDLDEQKVKAILNGGDPSALAENLTIAILERFKQKAILRVKYRGF